MPFKNHPKWSNPIPPACSLRTSGYWELDDGTARGHICHIGKSIQPSPSFKILYENWCSLQAKFLSAIFKKGQAWRALLLEKLSLCTTLLASHPAKAAFYSTAGFPDSQSSIPMNSWQRPGIFFFLIVTSQKALYQRIYKAGEP